MPHGARYGMRRPVGPSVLAIARQSGEFETLLRAVEASGLKGLLEGEGPYTLFAPTDVAFEQLPQGTLEEMLADKAKLTALLKYHVVPRQVSAVQVLESRELETASGQRLPTSDLHVSRADIRARNGIIHRIDTVLLPSG